MGSKNHEVVPLPLIVQISGLRNGGVNKLVGSLAKRNLISKVQNAKCDAPHKILFNSIIIQEHILRWRLQTNVWRLRLSSYACLIETWFNALCWKPDRCRKGIRSGASSFILRLQTDMRLSDIYVVADAEGNEMVLKLHRLIILTSFRMPTDWFFRLGRVSFRAIKEKRDYLGKRKSASWMYMSRLAAQKEWAFMKVSLFHLSNFVWKKKSFNVLT